MDEQFDRLIENELHSLSYESIPDANPYEHYMNYLIAGLFMIMININIGPLSYIEAVAGWLCMVLALRPLRHAGKWFSDAWLISCIELVYFLINALIANTIYREEIMEKMLAFALVAAVFEVMMIFFLGKGFNDLRKQSGLEESKTFFYAALWYGVLILLAVMNTSGMLLLVMIGLAIYLIISAKRIVQSISNSCFNVVMEQPKFDNEWICIVLGTLLAISLAVTRLLFSQYKMDWKPYQLNQPQQQLIEKGLPEELTEILDPEIINQLGIPVEVKKDISMQMDDQKGTCTKYVITVNPTRAEMKNVYFLFYIDWKEMPEHITSDAMIMFYNANLVKTGIEGYQSRIIYGKGDKVEYADSFIKYPSVESTRGMPPFCVFEHSLPRKADWCRGYIIVNEKEYGENASSYAYMNYIRGIHGGYPFFSGYQAYLNGQYDLYDIIPV